MGTAKEISVFIDESGSFDREDIASRYYLVCMVFHDQSVDLTAHLAKFEKEAFAPFASKTEFVPQVSPTRYRLFQLADILCTLELANLKLTTGNRLTESEIAFFGSIQNLRKSYLKPLARKQWG